MNHAMTVTFLLKNAKINSTGKAPIYVRITINGKRTEFSTKRLLEPEKWIPTAGIARGTSADSKNINAHINSVRAQLFHHFNQLEEAEIKPTCQNVKNAYFGIEENAKSIVEAYDFHNAQVKSLIGKRIFPLHEILEML
jgi:hypothetical protein